VPSDIVTADIDPETGYLVTPYCPRRMTEVFIAGTAPTELCHQHEGGYWIPEPDLTAPTEEFPQEEEPEVRSPE